MRRSAVVLFVVFMFCTALAALGQDKSVDVGWVYATVPKPGMTKQLEEGRKKHMAWHKKQGDTWTWEIWQVETGESAGNYLAVTFGHSWQDLDAWDQKYSEADTADVDQNMSAYIEKTVPSIWMFMKDASRPLNPYTPKMAQVSHYLIKPGKEADFEDTLKKMNEAINKSDWPPHYAWFALMHGGEQPHYALVYYMNGWAGMAEPEPSFGAMLEKAVGKHDADALTHTFDSCVHKEWAETIRYRPDLSYVPAK